MASTKVNGISYHLLDDCDTLICKLDNAAFEAFMNEDYDRCAKLEDDRDMLQDAFDRRDFTRMSEILENYRSMFKRYS